MKTLILILALASSHAFAADGRKAAELFIRTMVRASADLARQASGNDSRLEQSLCRQMPKAMAVSSMARNITDSKQAWTKASEADRSQFKKAFLAYLGENGVERLTSTSTVVAVSSSGSGNSYQVAAQIRGDQVRTSKYWLAANSGVLARLSDADLAGLESEFTGGSRPGSHSAVESKVQSAFTVYTFQVRGVEIIGYLKNRYNDYVAQHLYPGKLHPEYFQDREGVRSRCP